MYFFADMNARKKIVSRRRRSRDRTEEHHGGFKAEEEEVEADFLPLNNVMSIVKSAIPSACPPTGQVMPPPKKSSSVGKRVKCSRKFHKLLLRCLAEFFHILAIKLASRNDNKRIFTDEDILLAMESLGINQYSTCLRVFMSDYRELVFNTQNNNNHVFALRE